MAEESIPESVEFGADTFALVGCLAGLKFVDADRMLDEARRVLWSIAFAGATLDGAMRILDPPAPARAVAELLKDRTVLETEKLLLDARLFLWMQNYARVPGSRFGQQLAAFIDRSTLPSDPSKLN